MISSESNFLIENIPNKELQMEYFKKYLEIQKQSNNMNPENNNQYNLKTVLDKFASKPRSVGIQDLQNEISKIKLQINSMIVQNEDLETRLKVLEKGKTQIIEEPENIENMQLE